MCSVYRPEATPGDRRCGEPARLEKTRECLAYRVADLRELRCNKRGKRRLKTSVFGKDLSTLRNFFHGHSTNPSLSGPGQYG